jgi:uncharacterized protein YcbX
VRVDQIWQYPVKSMVGTTVPAADLAPTGLVGDRTWAVRDQVRGGIRGGKVLGGLMQLSARYVAGDGATGGAVAITLPDGSTVTTDDAQVDARVSEAIDHEVVLEALRPADDLDHYRRGEAYHDDLMVELRSIFGREEDEPLPDLSQFPPEILEYESPPGTYYDVHPLLLVTTSALRSLATALPESNVDVRRFRPSLVVDTGDAEGHPELGWIGQQLRIGDAVVRIEGGCPRCVMVTRRIDDDLPQDRTILRHIVRDLGQDVGVYATVVTPGRLDAGAEVELLP